MGADTAARPARNETTDAIRSGEANAGGFAQGPGRPAVGGLIRRPLEQ